MSLNQQQSCTGSVCPAPLAQQHPFPTYLYNLCAVNPKNISNVSHYCDTNSGLRQESLLKDHLSLLGTELFCAAVFSFAVPSTGKTSELWGSAALVFLQHNDGLCDKSAGQTCVDTHIDAVWPRSARGAWWAGLALRSRWTPLKHR